MSTCEHSMQPEMAWPFQNRADLALTSDGSKVRDKKLIAQPFTPNGPFLLLLTSSCFLANTANVVKPSCTQMHWHAHDQKMTFLLLSLWLLWLLPWLLLCLLGHLVICLYQNDCDPHSAGRVCCHLQNTSQNSRVKGRIGWASVLPFHKTQAKTQGSRAENKKQKT